VSFLTIDSTFKLIVYVFVSIDKFIFYKDQFFVCGLNVLITAITKDRII
jgi:hypothetical protein